MRSNNRKSEKAGGEKAGGMQTSATSCFNKDYEKLMGDALKALIKRRLTFHEMELKLRKQNIGTESEIMLVLKLLKELSYLDDKNFARDFIKDRLNFRPRGIFAIKRDLYKRGISKDTIEKAISISNINEEEVARDLAFRKAEKLQKGMPLFKKKQRLVFFLRSRGFPNDIIYKVVDEIRI